MMAANSLTAPPAAQSIAPDSAAAAASSPNQSPARQVRLRMVKQAGDRSFGMTLEQRYAVSPHDFAAVVSYIFPNSPADRVGIERGWMLLRINELSVRGMPVKDVAAMFRDHIEVDIELETRSYSAQQATPVAADPSANAAAVARMNSAVVSGFSSALAFQASLGHLMPPPGVQPAMQMVAFPCAPTHFQAFQYPATQFQPTIPAVSTPVVSDNAAKSTTPGRVISSPGSSLGVPASPAAVQGFASAAQVSRTVAAPAPPALNGSVAVAAPPTNDKANSAVATESIPSAAQHRSTSAESVPGGSSLVAPAQQPVVASSSTVVPSCVAAAVPHQTTVQSAAPAMQTHNALNGAISAPSQAAEPTSSPSTVETTPITATPHPLAPAASTAAVAPPPPPSTSNTTPVPPPSTKAATVSHATPVPVKPSHSATPSDSVTTTPASRKKRARPNDSASPSSSSDEHADAASRRARVKPRNRNALPDDSDSDTTNTTSSRPANPQLGMNFLILHCTALWIPKFMSFLLLVVCCWIVDPEPRSSPEQSNRRYSRRRGSGNGNGESTGRARTSLTVDRLVTMGFTKEDANASVAACGHNPDACMVWIVSHLEEKQFLNDLNQASIQSELSKRAEEKELKEQEKETLKKAREFTALFTTSFMLSSESDATLLKKMLADAIGDVDPDSFLRVVLTKLLKLEAQAIRWYKDASKCYLLQLAERLESSFGGHDVVQCCSKLQTKEFAESGRIGCAFVRVLHEEEQNLSKALFDMPENHGGVPLAFLKADKDMQFSLDDDGFEVLEVDVASDD